MTAMVEMFRDAAAPKGRNRFSCPMPIWELLWELGRAFGWQPKGTTYVLPSKSTVEAPARRDIPERVRQVIERGLAADPANRYPDMTALLAALRHAAVPRGRRRIAIAAVASLVVAGAAIPIGAAVRSHQHEAMCEAEVESVRVA